jgi:hypothetical protein
MRKLLVVATIAIAWMYWRHSPAVELGVPQAMVLTDGFGIVDGPDTGRVLVQLDRDGSQRSRVELASIAPDIRVVGARSGPLAVWIDRGKIALQTIKSDGSLGAREEFGTKATMLCEGVATNDHRFGVSWMEKDGKIWVVHGPVTDAAASSDDDVDVPKPTWCGVASADEEIALLWSDGKKIRQNNCDRRACRNTVAKIAIDPKQLVGFGCVFDGCLFATRDGKVTWFTERGSKQWTRELPDVRAGDRVSIIGGRRRFAVGYHTTTGAAVVRFDLSGKATALWNDSADQAPVLALSRDRLAISYHRANELLHRVIALP